MSSFKRTATAWLLCGLLLSGCGFQPLYGARDGGESVALHYRDIEIANIPDRSGQELRNALIDRLYKNGRPADAPLILKVEKLKIVKTGLGIRKDATATRSELEITAALRLVDRASGAVLLTRSITANGDYNQLDNQYASLVSERYVTRYVLDDIADSIVTELALYFNRAGQKPS